MAEDLRNYTKLKYENLSENHSDGFVEFLLENSELKAPEVDVDKAWARFNQRVVSKKRPYVWMKIAASIVILFSLSFAIYLNSFNSSDLHVASKNEIVNVTFPDGSIGVLNDHSSFSYPSTFGDERRVSFKGEAYFDIQKSTKPFIIDVNGVEVKVLGTAFNLISEKDQVTLYVDRGLVAFVKNGNETKIAAGTEAVFNKKTNEVLIKDQPTANLMSWRNGYFKFDETPLKEALKELGDYYDVDFKLANSKLNSCRISVIIEQKSLTQVVDILKSILDVKVDVKNKSVKISGQGC